MARRNVSFHAAFLAGSILAWPALAADVTPERLLNPDKEPQNWLMNHRTYNGQRFSPLARINKGNVKNLKLAYAVPLGGGSGNEFIHATPLAEDGFIYITDSWGVLYKIDGTSGEVGRIVWQRSAFPIGLPAAWRSFTRRSAGPRRAPARPHGAPSPGGRGSRTIQRSDRGRPGPRTIQHARQCARAAGRRVVIGSVRGGLIAAAKSAIPESP
jgi:hypothetical protein